MMRSGRHTGRRRLLATEALPFELSGRMGVGVDRQHAVQG